LIQKGQVILIVLLFIATCIIPTTARDVGNSFQSASKGDWLYVGGSGPGNYTKIQDAIDHASWFSTVFVYSGVYDEKIDIPKAISLIGESRNTTIISRVAYGTCLISLKSSNITISEFTFNFTGSFIIQCPFDKNYRDIVISNNMFQGNISMDISLIDCQFCSITQNIFYLKNMSDAISLSESENCDIANNVMIGSYSGGIFLRDSSYNKISNNSLEGISPHALGIVIDLSDFNTISNNTLHNYTWAIYIIDSENLSIISNHIENPLPSQWRSLGSMGIWIIDSYDILVQYNFISGFKFGIHLDDARQMIISKNTFMKNIVHARFYNTGFSSNTWDQNYWGKPRILPKPIFGIKYIYVLYPGFVEFDWHPAQEPYDI
jgi:parallel beta-helix repeat protein